MHEVKFIVHYVKILLLNIIYNKYIFCLLEKSSLFVKILADLH